MLKSFRYGDIDNGVNITAIEVFAYVDECLSTLSHGKKKMEEYIACIKEIEERLLSKNNCSVLDNAEFGKFLGITHHTEMDIENPYVIKNKGFGAHNRLRSGNDIGIQKLQRKKGVVVLELIMMLEIVRQRARRFNL
ncbi:hypothetical protein L2E82_18633 [Cichorium intybus]|uniref:Uncharacterized protein n=1 Tax=Cichorium intybus TaxID=13427 RepID=A0ACB9FB67_CICIN|nr:hypothetical protein L2E82_18633 [Cichorium intybus]